jgi:response regulator RpfG family c-di-GMP phosphodiesterase
MATERILIVDDEPSILHLTCQLLEHKYEVLSTSDPRNALTIIKTKPHIDLIISDIEMPGMRGPDLLDEVHKISPSTAGLLMSGNIEAAMRLPASTPFLQKPFSFDELYIKVEMVLARSRKLRADLTHIIEESSQLVEQTLTLQREVADIKSKSAEIRKQSSSLCKPPPNSNDLMQDSKTIVCAFCLITLSANELACHQCHSPVDSYTIVLDRDDFGIAFNGEIKLHGLTVRKAQELASILNSIK